MSPGDSTVLFRALPSGIRLTPGEKKIARQFAAQLAESVADNRPFTCLLTSDSELQHLNQQFLAHDYPTDVLSFPAGAGSADLGELAISVERAQAQAEQFGHSRADEICILMLHGVLHLTGYDHEQDGGEMARAEAKWRENFRLPATLIARSKPAAKESASPRSRPRPFVKVTVSRRTRVTQ